MTAEVMTLVLDTAMQPIGTVSWQDAICLWVKEKVDIVKSYDVWAHVEREIKKPAVVMLKRFFLAGQKKKIKFSRQNVYLRDGGTCQYCRKEVPYKQYTWDHVLPRTRGGKTQWTNIVASCRPCNQKKGSRTPEQAGMRLAKKPVKPVRLDEKLDIELGGRIPELWMEHLEWLISKKA